MAEAVKQSNISINWQRVGRVERALFSHKKPINEETLRLLEHGVNNGHRGSIERIFDANRDEILEAIQHVREMMRNYKALGITPLVNMSYL
ncbi:MAG: hypothetical protein QW112_01440 [Candidatus Micrarchaeia archaeon]